MSSKPHIERKDLLRKIRAVSNPYRFRILELTAAEAMNIKSISTDLKLSYTKCSDYVRILEKEGLVGKVKIGRKVMVKSNVEMKGNAIFLS